MDRAFINCRQFSQVVHLFKFDTIHFTKLWLVRFWLILCKNICVLLSKYRLEAAVSSWAVCKISNSCTTQLQLIFGKLTKRNKSSILISLDLWHFFQLVEWETNLLSASQATPKIIRYSQNNVAATFYIQYKILPLDHLICNHFSRKV